MLATPSHRKVSVHGGHSGQFCQHARDTLAEVVQAYIDQDFEWVGITEHMPPPKDEWRYGDEVAAGISAHELQQRFRDYFDECRRLRQEHAADIELYTAFETEMYDGALDYIRELVNLVRPDYLVGSVHHVDGICIDFSREEYQRALEHRGSVEALYCEYFDLQYALLKALKPAVVGHFDLVRIFDDNYEATLQLPAVAERVDRNLDFMYQESLILDYNLRGLHKGNEPYPSRDILNQAVAKGVAIAPGDDSHGVASVGHRYEEALAMLAEAGVTGPWPRPRLIDYSGLNPS